MMRKVNTMTLPINWLSRYIRHVQIMNKHPTVTANGNNRGTIATWGKVFARCRMMTMIA